MLQHIYSAIVYLRVLIKDQLPTRVGDICSELTDLVAERQKGTLLVTVITMLRDLQATTAPPPSPSPQPFPQVAHPSCHPLPLLPKSLNFLSLTSTFLRDSGNDNWSLVKSCPQYFLLLWRIYWQQYEQTFSTMTTFSLSVIGINQPYGGVGGYTPKIETLDDVHYQNPKPPISAWAPFKRLDQLTFVIDVIVTPAVPLHGLDWSDLPRTKVWAGGKIITLLHRSTWLCRVIAILGSLTTTERCFIEGTRDQPLGGAYQGNPPPPAIAKPWYYIMSGTISTAFLPEGI